MSEKLAQERLGEAQREAESLIHPGMASWEIADVILKTATKHRLSTKCWRMLEDWAFRTYAT